MTEFAPLTMPPPLATRARPAKAEHICPRCKHPVGRGVREAHVEGLGWCHVVPCITGGRMPMIGPSNEPHNAGPAA